MKGEAKTPCDLCSDSDEDGVVDLTDEMERLPTLEAQAQQMREVRAMQRQRWQEASTAANGGVNPPHIAQSAATTSEPAPGGGGVDRSRQPRSRPELTDVDGHGADPPARPPTAVAPVSFSPSQRPQPRLHAVPPNVSQPAADKLPTLRAMTVQQTSGQPPLNVIPLLERCLIAEAGSAYKKAFLCGSVQAFSQAHEADHKFGCGFRNIQVMASYLLAQGPAYRAALFAGQGIPNVPSLQLWLEQAWADGFDVEGAAQLGWHVHQTDTWIGSTDAAAMLRFTGVDARLYDIPESTAPRSRATSEAPQQQAQAPSQRNTLEAWTHLGHELREAGTSEPPSAGSRARYPKAQLPVGPSDSARRLFAWIWQYFETAAAGTGGNVHTLNGPRVITTNAPPVFVQHQGHSRSIIGIVRRRKPAPRSTPGGAKAAGRGDGAGGGRGRGGGRGGAGRGRSGGGRGAPPGRGDRRVTDFFTGVGNRAGGLADAGAELRGGCVGPSGEADVAGGSEEDAGGCVAYDDCDVFEADEWQHGGEGAGPSRGTCTGQLKRSSTCEDGAHLSEDFPEDCSDGARPKRMCHDRAEAGQRGAMPADSEEPDSPRAPRHDASFSPPAEAAGPRGAAAHLAGDHEDDDGGCDGAPARGVGANGGDVARVRGGAMRTSRAGGSTTVRQRAAPRGEDEWEDVLIVLDSQTDSRTLADALTSQKAWRRLLERGPGTWRKPCYQIMTVEGLLPADQRDRSKKLLSRRL